MREALGLSIGVANLVAAREGRATLKRRSVLTLFAHRPPEVGVPDENPNLTERGLVLNGFVAGIGGPAPFVAPDGSTHHNDTLAAEALDAMARTAGYGASTVVAVPGFWGLNTVGALRDALRSKPSFGSSGEPTLVSDATAALRALYARPGFPTDGVVVLCDFGAGGTSVTLSDAAANFRHIGETVRYAEFSGDRIDQAILHRIQPAFVSGHADTEGTMPAGSLSLRLDECRRAKELLSSATVTVVSGDMPGAGDDVRLFRTEFEELISEPLDQFVGSVEELLRRNGVPAARLAAVATVGGGACIPLVTERLEQRLHAPVVTTPDPMLSAAIGAATFAEEQLSADHPTAIGPAANPTAPGAPAPTATDIDPAAWAADAGAAAAHESPQDGSRSATYRALAWSEDDSTGDEPLAYAADDDASAPAPPAATVEPDHGADYSPAPAPPRRKRPGLLFGVTTIAALALLLAAGVVVFKLSNTNAPTPSTSSVPTPSRLPSVGPLPPPPPSPTETTEENSTPSTTEPPVTTTTVRTTTTHPTTTWQTTTTPPTTTSTHPPVTTTTSQPSTTVLVPPRLVPVTPTYPAYPGYPGYPGGHS